MPRILVRLLLVTALMATMASPTAAHDGLKGIDDFDRAGELQRNPGAESRLVTDNFRVLGHEGLGRQAPNGDISFHDHGGSVGKYTYVGTWVGADCSGVGVKAINVNDPERPRLVATIGSQPGSSHEDMVVARIGDRDVLAIGLQFCGEGGLDGLALYDVTNPRRPTSLSFFPTPVGVHELDVVVRPDGRALALLATPFSEFPDTYFGTDFGGEFRIVDITDPASPTALADWGIIADSDLLIQGGNDPVSSSFQGLGYFAATYAHSVRAADDGATAYVSYWDAGILKFDIGDPTQPTLVGRTLYPSGSDGDAHSMVPYDVGDTRYILQNDEDFEPLPTVLATSSATGDERFDAIQMPYAPALLTAAGEQVSAEIHDAGDGCDSADYQHLVDGKIALVDTVDPFYVGIIDGWEVPCSIDRQMILAARFGAEALLSNLVSPDDAFIFGGEEMADAARNNPGLEVVQVSDIDEFATRIRAAGPGVTVALTAETPSWGYLRIYQETASTEWQQVGAFAGAPHAFGEFPTPGGDWSIHNTEVLGDRAYSSWYSNGIVALDMSDPTAPQMVGQFVPPASSRFANVLGPGAAQTWGVAIDPETGYVYASDMRTGLWIVEPTGPAAVAD